MINLFPSVHSEDLLELTLGNRATRYYQIDEEAVTRRADRELAERIQRRKDEARHTVIA
jgi:hypothetical protein